MTEKIPSNKKPWSKMSLRCLRLSLKYRPKVLKLILKMRQCIRRRNSLLKTLKHRLKEIDTDSAKTGKIDSSTQTDDKILDQKSKPDHAKTAPPKSQVIKEDAGWNIENRESEKSLAEQVKEVAQNALQDTGMVYVESAGMYYDYKTGYYYNSELGLYYHTETGCYYYYSADKQFVFHSYPDMSKVNASLIAHQNKKARKLKRERKQEDDIDNLTKHLSQDKEEDGSNPKKPRKSKAKKEKRKEKQSKREKKKSKVEKMEVTEEIQDKPENEKDKNDSKDSDQTSEVKDVIVSEDIKYQDEKSLEAAEDKVIDIFDNNDVKTEIDDSKESSNEDKKASVNIDEAIEIEETIKVKEEKTEDKKLKEEKPEGEKPEEEKLKENKPEEEKPEEEKPKEEKPEELEDGECSDTESGDSGSESESQCSTSTVSDEDSVAKHHPPCMRVIVRETKLPKLKVGSLFLVTKDGGTVGREGDNHAILLRDHNVSRNHLDIRYDMAKKTYQATDLGSKNGTILNGVRMSESQEISLPLDILHGSTIQLGETKLLCHIHPGHATCGQCEPGLLMQAEEEKKVAYTRTVSVKKQYELELARLKNIYAPQHLAIEEKPYNDRAQARRDAVGSTNHAEKTQASDLDTSIASDNKGFKLLQKMGWSKGEGLGKDSQGDTEPVPLISNEGKAGLGTTGAVAPPSNTPKPRVIKNNIAAGTMRLAARTNMLKPPAKAFQNEDEEGSE